MNTDRSVLIVDRSADTREVLRTALARQGVRVFEASACSQGVSIANEQHPDVIVVDVDVEDVSEAMPAAVEDFSGEAGSQDTPIVILGTARQKKTAEGSDFFTKPYHYAPLIRTIEQRLDDAKTSRKRAA
ncbi:MAG: response regulator [Pirellulales bacterium]|nr:response regulator [Pirellulales bacterium]